MTSPVESYEIALNQALADEKLARGTIEMLRTRIANAEATVASLANAVDALLALIPIDRRARYAEKISAIRPLTRGNRGTTAYELIVDLLGRSGQREWTASEINAALMLAGHLVEVEQIHNVLNYLTRKKRLSRTSRGKYVRVGLMEPTGTAADAAPPTTRPLEIASE